MYIYLNIYIFMTASSVLEKEMATRSSIFVWRSLAGYSPRGHKGSDRTECTYTSSLCVHAQS